MSEKQPVSGTKLPEGTTSGMTTTDWERRYVLHATAPVYYPAPDGASYCNNATCTHDHPDTEAGLEQTKQCAERLARIIRSGRLPVWAKLQYPLPTE